MLWAEIQKSDKAGRGEGNEGEYEDCAVRRNASGILELCVQGIRLDVPVARGSRAKCVCPRQAA